MTNNVPTINTNFVHIIAHEIKEDDALDVIAEEAVELAQAALKLKRTHSRTNPTTLSRDDALRALCEEYTDLMLAVDVFNLHNFIWGDSDSIDTNIKLYNGKSERWYKRVKGTLHE